MEDGSSYYSHNLNWCIQRSHAALPILVYSDFSVNYILFGNKNAVWHNSSVYNPKLNSIFTKEKKINSMIYDISKKELNWVLNSNMYFSLRVPSSVAHHMAYEA